MVNNSPISSDKNSKKTKNPFKKILNDVLHFVKKDEEDNEPSSFEVSKTEKKQNSNVLKSEASKERKAKRSTREKKANNNEQKLPKRFKKGW